MPQFVTLIKQFIRPDNDGEPDRKRGVGVLEAGETIEASAGTHEAGGFTWRGYGDDWIIDHSKSTAYLAPAVIAPKPNPAPLPQPLPTPQPVPVPSPVGGTFYATGGNPHAVHAAPGSKAIIGSIAADMASERPIVMGGEVNRVPFYWRQIVMCEDVKLIGGWMLTRQDTHAWMREKTW